MQLTRNISSLLFLLVVVCVYATAFYIRGVIDTLESPHIIAAALAADIVILVPAAYYYFFVVRRLGLPVVSVAGIFVLSLIAATQIIPSDQRGILTPLEIVAVVAEVAILSFIAWKATKGIRRLRAAANVHRNDDGLLAIRSAAREMIDSERVADVFAYEIAVLYYGLGSWRKRPVEGPGRFTSHERNSYGSMLFGFGVLLLVELVAVHVLVQHFWSATGAWILSVLTAYAGVWLMAEWHSHRLRPTLIENASLVLRAGMRYEVEIPFTSIRSLRRISAVEDKPRGTLSFVALGDAHFEVTTHHSVDVLGVYGMRKSTNRIWFAIDNPTEFVEELSRRGIDVQ